MCMSACVRVCVCACVTVCCVRACVCACVRAYESVRVCSCVCCECACLCMCRVGQNRIYTPYMTIYLVISLPKLPYIHRIYMVLANPKYVCMCVRTCVCGNTRVLTRSIASCDPNAPTAEITAAAPSKCCSNDFGSRAFPRTHSTSFVHGS